MRIAGLLSSVLNPRRLRPFAAAPLWLAALLCLSCGGLPRTYYYTLPTPSPPALGDPKSNFVLGVEHFRASELLRDDRILYYESPTRVNYYQHHRWGSEPATMLSEFTAEWIEGTGVFAQVRMLPTREPVDYILRGRVFNFEEVDYEGGGKARVSLELSLVRLRDRKAVWSARRQAESPLQEKGIGGVANAMDRSIHEILREVLPGLIAQIEQDYKANQGQSP